MLFYLQSFNYYIFNFKSSINSNSLIYLANFNFGQFIFFFYNFLHLSNFHLFILRFLKNYQEFFNQFNFIFEISPKSKVFQEYSYNLSLATYNVNKNINDLYYHLFQNYSNFVNHFCYEKIFFSYDCSIHLFNYFFLFPF